MHEDIWDLGQVLMGNGYLAVHCGRWYVEGRSMRDSFHNLYVGKRQIKASAGEYYDRVSTSGITIDSSRPPTSRSASS